MKNRRSVVPSTVVRWTLVLSMIAIGGCEEKFTLQFQQADRNSKELVIAEQGIQTCLTGTFARSEWSVSSRSFMANIEVVIENDSRRAFTFSLGDLNLSGLAFSDFSIEGMFDDSGRNRVDSVKVGKAAVTFFFRFSGSIDRKVLPDSLDTSLLYADLSVPWLEQPVRIWFNDNEFTQRLSLERSYQTAR